MSALDEIADKAAFKAEAGSHERLARAAVLQALAEANGVPSPAMWRHIGHLARVGLGAHTAPPSPAEYFLTTPRGVDEPPTRAGRLALGKVLGALWALDTGVNAWPSIIKTAQAMGVDA
jgi:hypothetical protein